MSVVFDVCNPLFTEIDCVTVPPPDSRSSLKRLLRVRPANAVGVSSDTSPDFKLLCCVKPLAEGSESADTRPFPPSELALERYADESRYACRASDAPGSCST
ncbi:hypothetical protein VFPFJ_07632 [Purpureocillium lilacinum]|uniref:Uncharacterized protein n=1 Tax=Purpureocillium lilacinum TaxID=33203 RepID=A0A179H6R3_PURLI|nr:hypothetical protein VFPFJ_07632 [Purpureocillium lilacinum]OAQ85243.1 hypothetical protein VFPFJ_07632 [Purpureocillium lilacinum]